MNTKRLPAFAAALALCAAPLASAQQQQQRTRSGNSRNVIVRTQNDGAAPIVMINGEVVQTPAMPPMPPSPPLPPLPAFEPFTFNYVSSEMSFDARRVKGAPYTAEAVTETTQTLADGNRIVRRTSSQIARDSEGRTRREATVNLIGNVTGSNESTPRTVFINDPVANVNYVLDGRNRTARKMPSFRFDFATDFGKNLGDTITTSINGAVGGAINSEVRKQIDRALERSRTGVKDGTPSVIVVETKNGVTTTRELSGREAEETVEGVRKEGKVDSAKIKTDVLRRVAPATQSEGFFSDGVFTATRSRNTTTEQLGKQNIEGVEAEGTRTTTTIEAGKIGNERPIVITSERWYSPELQTVVMTRRNDPRHGETIYKLTNIDRGEPSRSLFEVPADYKTIETPANAHGNIFPRVDPFKGTQKQEEK